MLTDLRNRITVGLPAKGSVPSDLLRSDLCSRSDTSCRGSLPLSRHEPPPSWHDRDR